VESTGRPYIAKFAKGSKVRIAGRAYLQQFQKTWRHHHKLTEHQVDFAEQSASVTSVSFYHGGDVLYELEGVPGIWHESCLTAVTRS
jgi:hypothetical protein